MSFRDLVVDQSLLDGSSEVDDSVDFLYNLSARSKCSQ